MGWKNKYEATNGKYNCWGYVAHYRDGTKAIIEYGDMQYIRDTPKMNDIVALLPLPMPPSRPPARSYDYPALIKFVKRQDLTMLGKMALITILERTMESPELMYEKYRNILDGVQNEYDEYEEEQKPSHDCALMGFDPMQDTCPACDANKEHKRPNRHP